jgi:hypothetical protein
MNLLSSGETEKAMARLIQAVERDQVGAFQEFFDVQIADACVGYEDFALKIYKHVRKSSPEAAARFLSMYARRQKAFELHVKPWEVGSEVLDEALATYGHAS